MTRHHHERRDDLCLKQVTIFSGVDPTVDLIANTPKSPCLYRSGWEKVFPIWDSSEKLEIVFFPCNPESTFKKTRSEAGKPLISGLHQ